MREEIEVDTLLTVVGRNKECNKCILKSRNQQKGELNHDRSNQPYR